MNSALEKLYIEDQSDRKQIEDGLTSWDVVSPKDNERRVIVLTIVENGGLNSGEDYYHAAMVLQHGSEVSDFEIANGLCERAIEMGEIRALWLYAATLDRWMKRRGEPHQKFGTQYIKDSHDSPWYVFPIVPETTDEERAKYNVPPLREIYRICDEMNQK